ncbi:MAG: putative metallopeptidase [archaeon]|nr:putative metallopeptidase [archaeon]
MKYEYDEAWTLKSKEIAKTLGYNYVIHEKLGVVKSWGSKTKRTIARIHCIGKVMMLGMGHKKSFYVIELISENFDKQSEEDQIETIIHELMHIPKTFGGGFRQHHLVSRGNVKLELTRYINLKKEPAQARLF